MDKSQVNRMAANAGRMIDFVKKKKKKKDKGKKKDK
jgi:hypothetical protein